MKHARRPTVQHDAQPVLEQAPRGASRAARHGLALAVAGLLAVAPLASRAVTVTATNGVGLPGGTASVSFDVDFDTGPAIRDFFLSLGDTSPVLPFLGGAVTWNGLALSDPSVPAALADPLTFGADYVSGVALSTDALVGKLRLTYSYQLLGLLAGDSASVDLTFQYFDEVNIDFPSLTTTATVAAAVVPEPQSWALLLAGVAVLGATSLGSLKTRTPERTRRAAIAAAE